ncbi:MAG: hypothetical protein JW818_03925 [Pirellulales bacterium]|nr:hypothetical protein [Pirellulales bacterium]
MSSSKTEPDELLRQLESPREAMPAGRRPPTSGQPGSWRVVTADGSTTVGELARRSGGGRLGQAHPEVLLLHESGGGRPTTIKLRSADGAHVSLDELDLIDTEARRPTVGLRESPDQPPPNIGMPSPKPLLGGDLSPGAPPGHRSTLERDLARFDLPRVTQTDEFATLAMCSWDDRIVDPNGIDLDLVRVTEAWPDLPKRIREAILALLDAA